MALAPLGLKLGEEFLDVCGVGDALKSMGDLFSGSHGKEESSGEVSDLLLSLNLGGGLGKGASDQN